MKSFDVFRKIHLTTTNAKIISQVIKRVNQK